MKNFTLILVLGILGAALLSSCRSVSLDPNQALAPPAGDSPACDSPAPVSPAVDIPAPVSPAPVGPEVVPPEVVIPAAPAAVRPAPVILPGIRPEMKTPGFWIGKIQAPDRILLTRDQIRAFNVRVREKLGLTRDPASLAKDFNGRKLRKNLNSWLGRFRKGYFTAEAVLADPGFFDGLASNMDMGSIPAKVRVQWGMLTDSADQRLLPTQTGLFKEAGDTDIDRLQNNGLDPGTPLAILHWTLDREWVWVKGPDSDGWVRASLVALCPKTTLRALEKAPFAMVTRAKASLFWDRSLTRFAGFARMGTRLILAEGEQTGALAVRLPTRGQDGVLELKTGFLDRSHAVEGGLDYTPRHTINQAFELLNAPYGWGASGGEQDCSRFLQQVFASMGLHLPKNSAAQAKATRKQLDFTDRTMDEGRIALLRTHSRPGLSLLYMKGHIMLYLGEAQGQDFAINSLWGYWEPGPAGDVVRIVNRVAVAGLDLGLGSSKGAFLERLASVHLVIP